MTPWWLGYYKLRQGIGYAELSEGTGIEQEPIYGVTVRNGHGEDPDRLSKMFHSKPAALAYIESLSEGSVTP